jgi:alkanesulfonate monooxygenase SsuD/methylene tetrahydromethanopterin reductase-like flavin-dependent oxidoreductase (luciferase family)
VIFGAFGPKMAELAGRVADGINLPGGPSLPRLLELARTARVAAGRDPSAFVVTVSSDLRGESRRQLVEVGADRAVAFVRAPFADQARRLADALP